GKVKVDASKTTYKAEEGKFNATFYVDEEATTNVENSIQVLDGDVIDHGDEYTIVAKHVQLTRSQAEALTDEDLISRAKAKAFKREDMSAATVAIEKPYTVDSEPGVYKVTLYVAEEPTTKVEINVTVVTGSAPELTVDPTYINIPLGGKYDYTYGVNATDDEDGDLTSKVKSTGTVNVDVEGVYPIVYTVTDKDYNTVSKTRIVAVGDIIVGEDYLFKANNYVILKKDAKGTDAEILEKSEAQAWVKETGIAVPKANLEVRDNGGYKAEVGTYKTTISVKGATSAKDKVEPTARVIDGDIIDQGDEYVLVASNLVMTLADAQAMTSNEDLIRLTNAEAIKTKDMSAGTVKLETTTFKAAEGNYKATFYVDEEPTTKVTVNIKVVNKDVIIKGDKYYIGANNVKMDSSTASALTDEMLITLADAEAWARVDFSSAKVEVESHTIIGKEGFYYATFRVAAEPKTKVTVDATVTKTKLVIDASDFTITNKEAKALDEETVLKLAKPEITVDTRSRAAIPTTKDIVVHKPHLTSINKTDIKGGKFDLMLSVTHEGEEYVKVIKVTVQAGSKPSVAPPTKGVSTGDSTNIMSLWAMSLLALLSMFYVVRRRKEDNE
ncbi:LPXTG-motif cell wall-anchored protein, partial [Breznakia sp. PF5-3]|uniref:LPXTG cell wall anchor domain-containing protein n=1 Tax=unclassified Breznakia TaxID=2623764 RepID=UPI0024074138